MGILFGLTAALCWGIGDFVITRATRTIGALPTMFYVQLTGLLLIGLLTFTQSALTAIETEVWVTTVGIGLTNMAATLCLYRAFAVGTLSLVSPIASGFAVVTALLALLSGERPDPLALAGAVLLIGGVVVVSRSPGHNREARSLAGVPAALGAALGYGVSFWALGFVTPVLGAVWPVVITRSVALTATVLLLSRRGGLPLRVPRAVWPFVIGASLFDTVAFVAFNYGISLDYTAIVTALASLFSAVTVMLAWLFLRERLSAGQWAGVLVILFGVLLVSV